MARKILHIIFRLYQMVAIMAIEGPKLAISKRRAKRAFQRALLDHHLPKDLIQALTREYTRFQENVQDDVFSGADSKLGGKL
jgi:hypothetical protein